MMQQIKIITSETTLTATIADNAAAKDFLSLLPLSLTLADYNHTEKIADLPKRLSVNEAPGGYKPSAGDITYYAPWGNLAIFYKDFAYAKGLILIGQMTNSQLFNSGGSIPVTIEAV